MKAQFTPLVRRLVLGGVLACAVMVTWGAGDPSVEVIVNAANPTVSLSNRQVADLFLKKTTAWPDGTRATPVDLADSSPLREIFSKRFLGKPVSAVKSYWQQKIFAGRDVPPSEVVSPDEVVSRVRGSRGGIGYVPAGTNLGSDVKVVSITSE